VLAVGALGAQIGRHRSHARSRLRLQAVSFLKHIMGKVKSEAEQIDDEIAELRRKEQEDLEQLEKQFAEQEPSEEDLRVEALRRQQEQISRLMARRRAKRSTKRRPPQPAAPPLPWRCVLDMDSGRWYYYNEETMVTAWELPTEMASRPAEPKAPWCLVAHAASGKWYYHNTTTGVTSWDPPTQRRTRRSPATKRAKSAPRKRSLNPA